MKKGYVTSFKKEESLPYVVQFENKTDEPKTARLFGFNFFYRDKNNGSDEGIEVINLSGTTYEHLLSQSASNPFKTALVVLQSQNKEVFNKVASHFSADANGNSVTKAIWFQFDVYQQQSDQVNKHRIDVIDGNSYYKFEIPPKSKIVVSVYPASIVHLAKSLLTEFFKPAKLKNKTGFFTRVKDRISRFYFWFLSLFKRKKLQKVGAEETFVAMH